MLDGVAWLLVSALIHPRGVLFSPCLYGPCFVHRCTVMLEQERAIPQTVPTKLGAWNCPTSLGMLKH